VRPDVVFSAAAPDHLRGGGFIRGSMNTSRTDYAPIPHHDGDRGRSAL